MLVALFIFFVVLLWFIGRASLVTEKWVREEEVDLYCSLECSECDKPAHKISGAMTAPSLRNPAQLNAMLTFGELHRQDR
jgi:hypothetical protein